MKDATSKPLFRDSFKLSEIPENELNQEIQVLKFGNFYHPFYGEFNIDLPFCEKMVQNFNEKVRKIELAVDYSHNSDGEAAGWIKKLYCKPEGLFGEVEWTKEAKEKINDKRYAYISADFSSEYEDAETGYQHGPTLYGAALTNRPFIKDMMPVAKLSEVCKDVNNNVLENSNKEQLMDKELQAKNDSLAAELAELKKERDELLVEKQKAEEAKALSEKKSKFDKLLSEGKAVEAQRDAFMANDMIKFSELAVNLNLDGKGHAVDPKEDKPEPVDVEKKIIQLAEEKLKSKECKNIFEAQTKVLRENPDLYKTYRAKFKDLTYARA